MTLLDLPGFFLVGGSFGLLSGEKQVFATSVFGDEASGVGTLTYGRGPGLVVARVNRLFMLHSVVGRLARRSRVLQRACLFLVNALLLVQLSFKREDFDFQVGHLLLALQGFSREPGVVLGDERKFQFRSVNGLLVLEDGSVQLVHLHLQLLVLPQDVGRHLVPDLLARTELWRNGAAVGLLGLF